MILAHRCECGHPEHFHGRRGECSWGNCREKCQTPRLNPEPELLPTYKWDGKSHVVNEEILPPGSRMGAAVMSIVLCACDRCVELAG